MARHAGNERADFGTNSERSGDSMKVWKNGSMEVQNH
jgi:hypothetical protein